MIAVRTTTGYARCFFWEGDGAGSASGWGHEPCNTPCVGYAHWCIIALAKNRRRTRPNIYVSNQMGDAPQKQGLLNPFLKATFRLREYPNQYPRQGHCTEARPRAHANRGCRICSKIWLRS